MLRWDLTQLMQPYPGERGLRAQAVGLGDSQGVDGLPEGWVVHIAVLVGGVHHTWAPLVTDPPSVIMKSTAVMCCGQRNKQGLLYLAASQPSECDPE